MDIMAAFKIDKSFKFLSPFETTSSFLKLGIIILSIQWVPGEVF